MSVPSVPRPRGRSSLLLLVFAASLSLVLLTTFALTALVSDHVTNTALASSVAADSSLVRAFVAKELRPSDIAVEGVDPARRDEIQARLKGLIDPGAGTLRVKVYGRDGTIRYSDVPELVGQNFGFEEDLEQAFDGKPFADVTQGDSGEERDADSLGVPTVLEEYLPVVIGSDVMAVFEVYRDATPVLASVDSARRDTIIVTVSAATLLSILLYLIFRAAQRRLNRQTAELVEATRRDALTGLLNHGAVVTELATELETRRTDAKAVSAGLCFSNLHGDAATELLSVATVALGEAKTSGGDGVQLADAPNDEMRSAERSSFDVLSGLVVAVDTKDRYTKRHSEDVARYALFLAERMKFEGELLRTLRIAGLLHDVGKIGIPDQILRKPAALSAEEYAIVKQHVALGDAIVRDLPNLEQVRAGIRHHHERWDGQGYLDGLAGEEIPLIARILSVADAFSAMTTSRPYRKALSVREALDRLEDAAGSQLDEELVQAFVLGIETADDAPLPGETRRAVWLWTPQANVA